MAPPVERQDWRRMRRMFSTIAPRYDFITRTFSYGMDRRWKRLAVEMAGLQAGARVLDLASGTGDFASMSALGSPPARAVAVDLTEPMLRLARNRGVRLAVCANACQLPFPDATFDVVFVGYGLRNFPQLGDAIGEADRVMRPGGRLITLDFFLPSRPLLRRLYLGYLYLQGALWGLLLHGRPRIYTYIAHSLRAFVSMDDLTNLLRRAGYARVESRAFIFGGIGLHRVVKSDVPPIPR